MYLNTDLYNLIYIGYEINPSHNAIKEILVRVLEILQERNFLGIKFQS